MLTQLFQIKSRVLSTILLRLLSKLGFYFGNTILKKVGGYQGGGAFVLNSIARLGLSLSTGVQYHLFLSILGSHQPSPETSFPAY